MQLRYMSIHENGQFKLRIFLYAMHRPTKRVCFYAIDEPAETHRTIIANDIRAGRYYLRGEISNGPPAESRGRAS